MVEYTSRKVSNGISYCRYGFDAARLVITTDGTGASFGPPAEAHCLAHPHAILASTVLLCCCCAAVVMPSVS